MTNSKDNQEPGSVERTERMRMTNDSQSERNGMVSSTAWLDDLVTTWRHAAKEWRKKASSVPPESYTAANCYEDLAEAFDRCADMMDNRILAGPTGKSQGWWCEKCHTTVGGRDVTYDETHDQRAGGCGAKVV